MNRRKRGEERELRSLHTTVSSFNHHNTTLTHMAEVNTTEIAIESVRFAQLRPTFMSQIIMALEMLPTNLPPTLAKSQVSSLRKHLKIQLLTLLRHPRVT